MRIVCWARDGIDVDGGIPRAPTSIMQRLALCLHEYVLRRFAPCYVEFRVSGICFMQMKCQPWLYAEPDRLPNRGRIRRGEPVPEKNFSGCRRGSCPQPDLARGILQLPRYKSGGPTPRLELICNLRCAAECLSAPRHTMRCRRSGQTPFSVPIEPKAFCFLAAWLVSSPGHVGFCTIRGSFHQS